MVALLVLILCIVVCVFAYRDGNNEPDKAGKFGLFFSTLIPLVGIIMFFVQNNKVTDGNKYAKWAGIGFLVAFFGNILLNI